MEIAYSQYFPLLKSQVSSEVLPLVCHLDVEREAVMPQPIRLPCNLQRKAQCEGLVGRQADHHQVLLGTP